MTRFILIFKYLLAGFLPALILFMLAGHINETFAAISFFVFWPGCAWGLWYFSGRPGSKSLKPATAQPRVTHGKRLAVTAVLAVVFSVFLAFVINADVIVFSLIPFWLALYYGWPYLSRRVPFLDLDKAPDPRPKRPLWLRMIRGTLATIGVLLLAFACMTSMVIVPIALCERRAQKVANSIHVGMSISQVLDTAKDCDVFHTSSDAPYDKDTASDDIPAMGLSWRRDGTYVTYDLASGRDLSLTEAEAVQRLHTKLHDGYKWYFSYTYLNITPMHVSFSVIFGPDGRVSEVTPVHGWD